MGRELSDEYLGHAVFKELEASIEFYEVLSDLVWGFILPTRKLLGNLDSSFFDSLEGTVESIKAVLLGGRFADAYSLLGRFMETTRMQVFVMHRFSESRLSISDDSVDLADFDSQAFQELLKHAAENYFVEDVEKWLIGEVSLKVLRPSQLGSSDVDKLHSILDSSKYQRIVNRRNEYMHINYYRNLRFNHTNLDYAVQSKLLEQFCLDFRYVYAWHLAHVFTLHPEYMASTDYVDSLECGLTPAEGSQYWVAPLVQEVFDLAITPHFPEITNFIRQNCEMELR